MASVAVDLRLPSLTIMVTLESVLKMTTRVISYVDSCSCGIHYFDLNIQENKISFISSVVFLFHAFSR